MVPWVGLGPEPALAFEASPFRCHCPFPGYRYPLHARGRGCVLVVWVVQSPIRRYESRGVAEETAVVGDAGGQLRCLWRIALQDGCPRNDPAIHPVQPDIVPELGRFAALATADDGGVGLKDADHLLTRRYRLTPQHAPPCLLHRLVHQWHNLQQRLPEPVRTARNRKQFLDPSRLTETGPGDREQSLVAGTASIHRILPPAPGALIELPGQPLCALAAIAKEGFTPTQALIDHGLRSAQQTPKDPDTVRQ